MKTDSVCRNQTSGLPCQNCGNLTAVALTGALVFVRNVRTSVLTRYLYSFLMSMALFLHLVSLVVILSYAPENTFTLLRVFGEALVPIVLAVIVIFPFSLLLNDILQDNKKTIDHQKYI